MRHELCQSCQSQTLSENLARCPINCNIQLLFQHVTPPRPRQPWHDPCVWKAVNTRASHESARDYRRMRHAEAPQLLGGSQAHAEGLPCSNSSHGSGSGRTHTLCIYVYKECSAVSNTTQPSATMLSMSFRILKTVLHHDGCSPATITTPQAHHLLVIYASVRP